MAYDSALAERIRELLDGEPGISEKKMFGGLAFLAGGHMAIAASGQGGALVRVDPGESDHLVDTTSAEVAVMQGRPMTGWLRVPADSLDDPADLDAWVRRGVGYARSLPAKS
jgi:TfoX/Sxy family transcriptional regulator of competence genes